MKTCPLNFDLVCGFSIASNSQFWHLHVSKEELSCYKIDFIIQKIISKKQMFVIWKCFHSIMSIFSKKKYQERKTIMSQSSKNGTLNLQKQKFCRELKWCDWGAPLSEGTEWFDVHFFWSVWDAPLLECLRCTSFRLFEGYLF